MLEENEKESNYIVIIVLFKNNSSHFKLYSIAKIYEFIGDIPLYTKFNQTILQIYRLQIFI